MGLVEQIDKDLTAAMKEQRPLKLSVLRMMKSALKLKQVELGKPVTDAEALAVLRTLVKQRHESAELFRKGGRDELADKEVAEIKIVESYMPAAAGNADIDKAVAAAIAETGATGEKDVGKVMKATMAKLAGKNVDGKHVNERVRARLRSYMTDALIMLLSTDWFLPYWTEIGINIAEDKRIRIQQGCREIIEEILGGSDNYYLAEFSEERKQETESRFIALLRRCEAEREVSATLKEWRNLSHRELTAMWECANLNRQIPSADGSGSAPYLELPIRAEVVKTWEAHDLDAAVFEDICLSSKTEWDIRTQKMLNSPKTLKNELWRVLLDHRLRAFWADLRERLAPQQLQQLTSLYRAMIKITTKDDRPVLPSYME